jgi:hypothetical protein
MPPRPLVTTILALLGLFALPGCTALQEIAALRLVSFRFASVSDVRLVGIPIGAGSSYSTLGLADLARLAAAVASNQAPIEMVAHVSATNPPENKVAARIVQLGWTLFVEERQALTGGLDSQVTITPGRTADVPLAVRFDLFELGGGRSRDLFDVALAIAGQGTVKKNLRLELVPTIETSLGPIRFPAPVVVSREVGSR